jgi:glucose-6-phosphate isomerase
MSERLRLDDSGLEGFVREEEILGLQEDTARCHRMLFDPNSPGGGFWLGRSALSIRCQSVAGFRDVAATLQQEAEALVGFGIGGSYLRARAVIRGAHQ